MNTAIRRVTAGFVSLAAFALLVHAVPVRAAIPPAEKLLPADTLAFFTVPDAVAFRAAYKVSPGLLFWNDPAMKPFHDKFMGRLNEKYIAPLEQKLGMKVADLLTLSQGQFTLATIANGSGHADAPGELLLLDAKDQGDRLKTTLALLTKKMADAGGTVRTETIHGLDFTVVVSSNNFSGKSALALTNGASVTVVVGTAPTNAVADGSDDEETSSGTQGKPAKAAKPEKPVELYFAQHESLLIAGSSAQAVDAVAAHLTGGSLPALADDATFVADQLSQFHDAPLGYGWFNCAESIRQLTAGLKAATNGMQAMLMQAYVPKILAATGLDGLKSAGFTVRETPAGSTLALHLNAPAATRNGLLKILALPAKDAGMPAFVPSDATEFSRIRLDGQQTWAELVKIATGIEPASGPATLNMMIDSLNKPAQKKDPGFDLRKTVLANLGDDLVFYGKGTNQISLIAVSHPDAVVEGVRNLTSHEASQVAVGAPRKFHGHTIVTVALKVTTPRAAKGGAAPSAPQHPMLYLSSAGGYLAITKNVALLEDFLRNADSQLKTRPATPGIAEAATHVGGTGGGLFLYRNQLETMRAAFDSLDDSGVGGPAMMMLPTYRDWADVTLLPDFDSVAKYFSFSVIGATATADGLTWTTFSPRPPQLR